MNKFEENVNFFEVQRFIGIKTVIEVLSTGTAFEDDDRQAMQLFYKDKFLNLLGICFTWQSA